MALKEQVLGGSQRTYVGCGAKQSPQEVSEILVIDFLTWLAMSETKFVHCREPFAHKGLCDIIGDAKLGGSLTKLGF